METAVVEVDETVTRSAKAAAAVRVTSMDPCTRTGGGVSWVATYASTATGRCTHLGKARRCTTLLSCCSQEHTVAADPPRWWPGYRTAAQGSTPPAGCEPGASTADLHPRPAHMRSHSSYRAATAANSDRRAAALDSAAWATHQVCGRRDVQAGVWPARTRFAHCGRGGGRMRNIDFVEIFFREEM